MPRLCDKLDREHGRTLSIVTRLDGLLDRDVGRNPSIVLRLDGKLDLTLSRCFPMPSTSLCLGHWTALFLLLLIQFSPLVLKREDCF